MTNVLRLAIVDPDDSKRESVKSMLLGMDMIWLEAECSRYEFFSDVVAQTNPDIGLVALDDDPDRALELVTRLSENVAQLRRAGYKFVARRATDPSRDARRSEGVPHAADADRRSAGRLGTHQRAPQWIGREPHPRKPGRSRGRLAGRRGHYQPRCESGLRAGAERKEHGSAGRYGPLPGRRRRLPGRDPRLHPGRRVPERHAVGLQPLKAIAHEAFFGRLSAAASRSVGRLRADHARRSAPRNRPVEGDLHAPGSGPQQGLQPLGHGGLGDGQPHPAGDAVGPALPAERGAAD